MVSAELLRQNQKVLCLPVTMTRSNQEE